MKSFVSLLTALVLAVACIGCAFAEDLPALTLEAEARIDKDVLQEIPGLADESRQQAGLVADILNALKFSLVISGNAGQLTLKTDKDTVADLGLQADENGINIASSLLGDKVIQVPREAIQSAVQTQSDAGADAAANGIDPKEIAEAVKKLDPQKVAEDLVECFQNLTAKIELKIGAPEAGTWEVDGMTFTAKVPVNLTFDDMMELFEGFAGDFLGRESVSPLTQIKYKGQEVGPLILRKIGEIRKMPENRKPEITMTAYMNDNGDTYFTVDTLRKGAGKDGGDEILHAGFGQTGGKTVSFLNGEAKKGTFRYSITADNAGIMDMEGDIDAEGSKGHMTVHAESDFAEADTVIQAQEREIRSHVLVKTTENGMEATEEVYLNGMDKPLVTMSLKLTKGGEVTSRFGEDGVTVVPLQKLMDTNDSSTLTSVLMEVYAHFPEAMNVLYQVLPEESVAMLKQMIQPRQNP